MRTLFILWLVIYFTSGCAGTPVAEKAPIEATPPAKTEMSAELSPELAAEFDAAFNPVTIAAREEAEAREVYEAAMPQECKDAPETHKRNCWHLYLTTYSARKLGEECDYSFQCGGILSTMTCQFGVDKTRAWVNICTYKLPGEK